MIVDTHQHFWHYDPDRLDWIAPGMEDLMQDWLPADLAAPLGEAGVDATVAVQAVGDEAETEFLMQQAAAHHWIAGVVGWIDLTADNVAERIAHWQQAGPLVGLRHQTEDEPAYLSDAAFDAGVAIAQRNGLIYEVLVNHRQLDAAVAFCGRHDEHVLVVDHLAKPAITADQDTFADWRKAMVELADMPHIAVKISGVATEAQPTPGSAPDLDAIRRHLDTALELFGEDRLIFGSDWPVCRLAISYQDWFEFIDAWARTQGPECRRKLLGENAISIYSLQIGK